MPLKSMRKKNSKGKTGILMTCPKCRYTWRSKQKGYVCCSRCKRYFKRWI